MNNDTRMKYTSIVFRTMILLLLSCVSCQMMAPNQTLSQVAKYEVTARDVPAGWKFTGQSWSQNFGGQSHLVSYGIDNNTIISLAHTVSIYSDEEQAKIAYPKWEAEWLGQAWQKQPQVDFVPSDPSDDYKFECLPPPSDNPIIGCRYLQRHKQFISFVLVNLDGKSMTFEQLHNILRAVDDRLNGNN